MTMNRTRILAVAATAAALTLQVALAGTAHATGQPIYLSFTNVNSGKCLDVLAFGTDNGTKIVQYTCNGYDNQKFAIADQGNGLLAIKGKHSGKCVDVASNNIEEPIIIFDCTYRPTQLWQFEEYKPGQFSIRNASSGRCIDVARSSTDSGANAIQYECHHGNGQLWK
jgi:hypothetical protein